MLGSDTFENFNEILLHLRILCIYEILNNYHGNDNHIPWIIIHTNIRESYYLRNTEFYTSLIIIQFLIGNLTLKAYMYLKLNTKLGNGNIKPFLQLQDRVKIYLADIGSHRLNYYTWSNDLKNLRGRLMSAIKLVFSVGSNVSKEPIL